MALLNDPASQPPHMWAVVRYLAFAASPQTYDRAKALLSPPSLDDDGKAFEWAVETLKDLGMVAPDDTGRLRLAGEARQLHGDDFGMFRAMLRARVLAPESNTDLGANPSQAGPRDLTRALAWFLSLDPMTDSLNWKDAERLQDGALRPEVGKAIVNNFRWSRFVAWAPALGFASADLLIDDRCVPDCTTAVKQAISTAWTSGHVVDAVEALRLLRGSLPVLPGGEYSTAVGVPHPGDTVAGHALSFALLRADHEGFLRLGPPGADARQFLSLHEPDRAHGRRACGSITIMEDGRA